MIDVKNFQTARRFAPDKMQKCSLFQSERFFCDVYCLEPGQAQAAHAHAGSDKIYAVIEQAAYRPFEGRRRVVIVDDHTLVRDGTRRLLEIEDGLEVVGVAANGVEALDRVRETRPDVVLMDIEMPQMDGIEATQRIAAEFPRTAVIALSAYDSAGNESALSAEVSRSIL